MVRTQLENLARRLAPLAFVFFVVVLPVQAISLNEYRDRVTRAVTALDSLAQTDEDESTYDYAQRNADTLKAVRETLPASQTAEWGGTTFKIDNSLLHAELARL